MRELKIHMEECKGCDTELGKRSKFGGAPEWIQNDETPQCECCRSKMEFIAQLDSIDYTGSAITSGEYMFGDVGMIYIFFCKDCGNARAVFQE